MPKAPRNYELAHKLTEAANIHKVRRSENSKNKINWSFWYNVDLLWQIR